MRKVSAEVFDELDLHVRGLDLVFWGAQGIAGGFDCSFKELVDIQ